MPPRRWPASPPGRRSRSGRPAAPSARASAPLPRPAARCRHRCSPPPAGRRSGRRPRRHWWRRSSPRRRPSSRTGSDSPVSADWSSTASPPSATVPSAGTTSPWRTSTRSPGSSTSIGTCFRSPSSWRSANFGARSSSAVISRRARRDGIAFEELAAGIHQRDDDAGQRLLQRQRAGHRQQRHDVEPDLAVAERDDDLGEAAPAPPERSPIAHSDFGGDGMAEGPRRKPGRQSRRRNGDQHMTGPVDEVAHVHRASVALCRLRRIDPRQFGKGTSSQSHSGGGSAGRARSPRPPQRSPCASMP